MINGSRMLYFLLFVLVVTFISLHAFDIIHIPQTLQRILTIVHWSHLHLFPISWDIIILSPWECNSFTTTWPFFYNLLAHIFYFLLSMGTIFLLEKEERKVMTSKCATCSSTEQNRRLKACICSLSSFFAFDKAGGEDIVVQDILEPRLWGALILVKFILLWFFLIDLKAFSPFFCIWILSCRLIRAVCYSTGILWTFSIFLNRIIYNWKDKDYISETP